MESKYIVDLLKDEFIEYASPILINNLPSIDGLLPVNRKVIYALYKNKVTHDKPFIKMLRASAMAMPFYIFGDQPLTGAMKNMGNNTLNYMYLEPKGSFGNKQRRDGVGASSRYIECRMSMYAEDLLKNINKINVPMKRNFDNTEDEPIVLSSTIPNVLTNNSQSIAVGESSKIPSHNLIEVCDCFINYINTKDIDSSIKILKGVDFSIAGQVIYDKETFNKIYKTGRGSFTVLGNYKYNEKESILSIIEVPYETYLEDIEDKLRQQYDKGNFKEITDIHDGSDKEGIRLDIYLKKNTNIEQFVAKLRKYTPYESKISCNFTILDLDGKTPMLMNLETIIQKWTLHRHNCITKECNYDIDEKSKELNKLYGLKTILNDLDKAISIIRSSKSESVATQGLINFFNLNKEQVEYISSIKLININKDWIQKKIDNIGKLESEIKDLKDILNNPSKIDNMIVEQLMEVKKKYGVPRKTQIIYPHELEEISTDQLIDDYSTYIILTKENYLKKLLRKTDTVKLKDGDTITYQTSSSNKSTLLLFSNKGVCYKIYQHEINECKPSELGLYLPTHLELDKDERIISMINTRKYEGFLLSVFESGKVAKVNLTSFKTQTMRSKLQNALNIDSPLIKMFVLEKDTDLLLMSDIDKVLITSSENINSKDSKNTIGVQVMKSKKDSKVVMCELLENIDIDKIEDIEYYKGNTNSIGTFLKKSDMIIMK